MAGRSSSIHVGQKVRPGSAKGVKAGARGTSKKPGAHKGGWAHTKSLATRLPKAWGRKGH